MTLHKILITGGAGFIGSALIRKALKNPEYVILNVDKLTYAADLQSLKEEEENSRYSFEKADICNEDEMKDIFNAFSPDLVMHLAAESHVDRSIEGPQEFLKTNIMGTYNLLEQSRACHQKRNGFNNFFRFHHVSTDEVYGDLGFSKEKFIETTSYDPSSPYSASKASSDHLVRAWGRTYGLPYVITNCSNNYGPYQNLEKFIPFTITNALQGKPILVYGNGRQIRDWLYVDDHADALIKVALKGVNGETYNIGGFNEKTNLEVVKFICKLLDELAPEKPKGIKEYEELITFVDDRPGHDQRYAIDASKIKKALSWEPSETFDSGLRKTVQWYLNKQNS